MKKNRLNGSEIFTAALTLILLSWVFGFIFGVVCPFSAADIAAWAQAIFSVIAIVAAIWISQAQRRHDIRQQNSTEKKSVIAVLVLIERGRALAEAMAGIEIGDPSRSMLQSVTTIAEKLESLELIDNPSPVLIRCSLHAANYLRICLSRAEERRFRDMHVLVESLQKSHDQIMRYYGITEADYLNKVDWNS